MAKYIKEESVTHHFVLDDDEFSTLRHGHVVKIRNGNDGFLIIRHSENGD